MFGAQITITMTKKRSIKRIDRVGGVCELGT
jgi:hypothetical protein